jgi:TRAP-type mannitol/chloroaromatic compound transport system permease small subunit
MNHSTLSHLGKGFVGWSSILNACATGWIFVILIIMNIDMFGRFFFAHSLTGTMEIVKNSIVAITFIQLPHTVYMNKIIRTDVLLNRMGPVSKDIVTMISFLMGLALCLAIFIASWPYTVQSWKILEFEGEGAIRFPVYPIRTLILIGVTTTAIHFIVKIRESVMSILAKLRKEE